MMKQQQFQEVFASAFKDSKAWRRWFFDNVAVKDDEIYLSTDENGKAHAALLAQRVDFIYRDRLIPAAYISCVATRPESRSRGLASGLMRQAMAELRDKGVALATLIPARPHLYFFYDRFDFATAFYIDRERYTALHIFPGPDNCEAVEPSYELFRSLEEKFGCGVLTSEEMYRHIIADLTLEDEGYALASRSEAGSAVALAVVGKHEVEVKALLSDDDDARQHVLRQLRQKVGEKPVVVCGPPVSGEKQFLRPRGMARILNVQAFADALGTTTPNLRYGMKIHDELLPDNTGFYSINGGKKTDLDCDIRTLTGILFSNEKIGNIFGLPTRRPYLPPLLD